MKLKRLQAIREYIRRLHVCTYEDLARDFDISMTTVRRDVDLLTENGFIEKVHGGIRYIEQEDDSSDLFVYEYAKDRIGKAAASLVEDNDIIVLGSGTTASHMVRHLRDKKGLTVITNNLAVLRESVRYGFSLVFIGGNFDRRTLSVVGTQSVKQMGELNANKCFLSCNGITEHGISNVADQEAEMKKETMKISSKVYLLADHTKFGVMSLYNFAQIEELDGIITDRKPDEEFAERCREKDVTLMIAEQEES